MHPSKIKYLGHSLLVSLFSVNPGEERNLVTELENSFKDYLSRLKAITSKHFESKQGRPPTDEENYFGLLYQPSFYLVMGSFDVGGVCLIDDFELIHKLSLIPYRHAQQFFVGMFPSGDGFESQGDLETGIFQTDFRERFPLLAISQLKISPLWTCILGFELIDYLLYACRKHLDELERTFKNSISLILYSLGWSEILLLVFSRSATEIADIILDLREKDICSMFEGYALKEVINRIETSPIAERLRKSEKPGDVKKSHVFATSYTTCGFNFEIFDGLYSKHLPNKDNKKKEDDQRKSYLANKQLNNLCEQDTARFVSTLCCRPGHLLRVHKNAGDILGCSALTILIGRQDYVSFMDKRDSEPKNLADRIRTLVNLEAKVLEEPDKNPHIFKTRTMLAILPSKELPDVSPDHIYGFRAFGKEKELWIKLMKSLKINIRKIMLPKNLVFEIDHIFSLFDMCVKNFLLIDEFSDLYPFIKRMAEFLATVKIDRDNVVFRQNKTEVKLPFSDFIDQIVISVESFKSAFANRYLQSYSMNEVTDFTFEFRGSIHQIIAAVNGFSNTLLDLLDDKEIRGSIVIVGSQPGVLTMPSFAGCPIYFNYHLIFEPMELAAAYHEVGHYFMMTEWAELREYLWKRVGEYFKPIEDIFCDMFRFQLGFLGDWELFTKFYWSRFPQVKIKYRHEEHYRRAFWNYTARYLLATCPFFRRELCKYVGSTTIFKTERSARKAMDRCRDRLAIARGFEPLISEILDRNDSRGRTQWEYIYCQCKALVSETYLIFQKLENRLTDKLAKLGLGFKTNGEMKLPSEYNQETSFMRESLSSGKPLIVDPADLKTDFGAFFFAQKVLYAYLHEAFKNIDIHHPCITREEGEIKFSGNGNLFIDPAGGSFVSDYQFRSKFQNLRIATIASLFDLAEKRKKQFIEQQLA